TLSDGTWSLEQTLVPNDVEKHYISGFGQSVDIENGTIVATVWGGKGFPPFGIPSSDAAIYVFNKKDGQWTQTQKIVPPISDVEQPFGDVVKISGDNFLTTFHYALVDGLKTGSAYIYSRGSDGLWNLQQTLAPPPGTSCSSVGCFYGISAALDGD